MPSHPEQTHRSPTPGAPPERAPFSSYMTNAFDWFLLQLVPDCMNLRYLELSPPSPTIGSVSYALYLRGARGTLADMTSDARSLSLRYRPLDTAIEASPDTTDVASLPGRVRLLVVHGHAFANALAKAQPWGPNSWDMVALVTQTPTDLTTTTTDFLAASHTHWQYDDSTHLYTHRDLNVELPEPLRARLHIVPSNVRYVAELTERAAARARSLESAMPLAITSLVPTESDAARLAHQLHESAARIEALERQIAQLHASTSWQLTRPLRRTSRTLRALLARAQR